MYYYWSRLRDFPLFVRLNNADGTGATGKTPGVLIQRDSDSFFWNGTAFAAPAVVNSMSEADVTNLPGLYTFTFPNATLNVAETYRVYYQHTVAPIGFDHEIHISTDELFIPSSNPIVPILGDTVVGRLEAMEDPTKAVALANADAVWDEPLADHLSVGSTGEALSKCAALLAGSRQVTIHVQDNTTAPVVTAQVDIFDATNTTFIGRVFTNGGGDAVVALNDATYQLRIFASGFTFTVPETIVVVADATFIISGTIQTNIFVPSAPNLCVIFGTLVDASGKDLVGAEVKAFSPNAQAVGGLQLADPLAEATTDQDGFFQIELVRLATVQFTIEKADLDFVREVPDLASQDLTTWPP